VDRHEPLQHGGYFHAGRLSFKCHTNLLSLGTSFRKLVQVMPVSQEVEPEPTIYRTLFLSDVHLGTRAARPGFCWIS